jgi:hypothetical protein
MQTASAPRVVALDMTKGLLVVLMVVYHSINYTAQPYLAFQYIGFLPPSFILIAGFLITNIYSARYTEHDWRPCKRLLLRGAKLLALFTVLNIVAHVTRGNSYAGQQTGVGFYFEHWFEVYVLGSGRLAAFEVLLPISYLLLLAPLFIMADHLHRLVVPAITIAFLLLCTFLDSRGNSLTNLNLISAGMVGMLLGRAPMKDLDFLGRRLPIAALVYSIYFALCFTIGQTYLVQLFGACAALALIYSFSVTIGETGWPQSRLVRLGRYSLVSYIVQIAILQVLARVTGRPDLWSFGFLTLFFGALILMTIIVEAIEWARTRSFGVETVYKAVFA